MKFQTVKFQGIENEVQRLLRKEISNQNDGGRSLLRITRRESCLETNRAFGKCIHAYEDGAASSFQRSKESYQAFLRATDCPLENRQASVVRRG